MGEIRARSGLLSRTRLHVEDTGGAGRAVVLIHGWPLSGEAWSAQVPALVAAGYRVITYDRRGFGRSDRPGDGYDYDSLAQDLESILDELELTDVTLVGFSMGGGEVARYITDLGEGRLRSVVFAAAVTPYMLETADNPGGPLAQDAAVQMSEALEADRVAFFDAFCTTFFSAGGELKVAEDERRRAVALCEQSDATAALACMTAFATTDFRDDLTRVGVPTLVIHGSADATVPFEGSGARTHAAVPHSTLVVIDGAPHGLNVSHAGRFNEALLAFLAR